MAKNIALRIKVEFVETESGAVGGSVPARSADRCPQEQIAWLV
jgi:hypothetical protein